MERRNNGTGRIRIQLPELKRMDTRNILGRKQLDQMTVKDITRALKTHKEPGCKASWEKRLKLEANTVEKKSAGT